MNRIACLGDNCVDWYDETDEKYPGGNPVNVAVYLKRLGAEASYIGAVGKDAFGKLITDSLEGKDVDISHVKVLDGRTAITHVRRVNGERVFGEDDPGVCALLSLSEEDLSFIAGHDLVVTGLWGYAERYLPKLKQCGIPIAYDGSDRPFLSQGMEAIPHADYVFFSDDISEEGEIRETMKRIAEMGPAIVVAMRGSQGSIALAEGTYYSQGIISCEVVDTMGAGDSFIAGFLNAHLEGADIPLCMERGAMNSAVTISYPGAW